MPVNFEPLDQKLIAEFGKDVTFIPSDDTDSPETVRLIIDDARLDQPGFKIAFGNLTDSGFSRAPVKNDVFIVDSLTYKAFDVQGPDQIGGYEISLTK